MITHDRWQRIKEIFHSAQDLAPAERIDFLNRVCGDDESIREEVEALLIADAGNDDFLNKPAYEFAAGMLASEVSEFSAGQEVGRYTILCPLGSGGMGQIYLARDTVLGRKIALKLISPEFATDRRRVDRFEQEARAASALNHPNVCVIHETGITDNGRHFIAMEYIQGITLRDQLSRGPLEPIEALRVAVQVGAALASAHAAGIVHRDIKPENIMLRPDGYVKVVDFGLAKLTEVVPEQQSNEPSTNVRTEPRTLMGTVKYMSPEQLREARLDERTDIWSLGVVLYEMLTGITPFEAEARNDTVALILNPQPATLQFPAELPRHFRDVVKKALEKDRNKRYQTVSKLASDLSQLQRELERNADHPNTVPGIQPPPVSYSSRIHVQRTHRLDSRSAIFNRLKSQALSTADFLLGEIRSHKTAVLFAGATTSVFAFLYFFPALMLWLQQVPDPEFKTVSMKAFTNNGTSIYPAISSDGKFVAHAEEQNGKQLLVVTNTATFVPNVVIPPEEVKYLSVSFSRDNNYLYFTRRENKGPITLYRVSLPGSTPEKVKENVDSPISFSPQGNQFAFVRLQPATNEYSLMVSDIDGTNERVITSRKDGNTLSIYGLAWSPDGDIIVCPVGRWENGFHVRLVGFDWKSGRETPIGLTSWFSILQVAWQQNMGGLIISARERPTAPHQIWRITYPDGVSHNITNDLAEYWGVSLAGQNLVTVRVNRNWHIWVAAGEKATPIISGIGMSYGLAWTRSGRIVFSSMAQDRLNLSRIDPDGSNQHQLTVNAEDNYHPAACRGDNTIVFSSNRNGAYNIWRMNAEDSSDLKQLTFSDSNFYPACSPDNQWVAYDNLSELILKVFKVPLVGGEPVKVVERYRMPAFSPDNQYLACRYFEIDSESHDVAIFSAYGGPPLRHIHVPRQEWQRVQWIPNGRLSYIKNVNGHSNLWSYDVETGDEKQLTNFDSEQIYAYAWSPDYKQVACQRVTKSSDVTIISNEQ